MYLYYNYILPDPKYVIVGLRETTLAHCILFILLINMIIMNLIMDLLIIFN